MQKLFIDLETRSSVDLKQCGLYKYVESPDFEIQLLSYAFGDEEVTTIDISSGEEIPDKLRDKILSPDVQKWAWNVAFERICLSKHLLKRNGVYLDPSSWYDDMVLAAVCGLPMSLDGAGKALGLPEDKAKDKAGKQLIRWFAKPCKPTKTRPDQIWHDPKDYPDKWAEYKSYNAQDVEAERNIHNILHAYEPTGDERRAWVMDQLINDRGVHIDMQLPREAVLMDKLYKDELTEEAIALTGMSNPSSVAQIKDWLKEQEGLEVASLNKKVVADVVAQLTTDKAKQFMALRKELAKSSTKKYDAMVRAACEDNHGRGCFQFYGAGRTGRWAGRLIQLQNLSKNKMSDIDSCRNLVRDGDYDTVKLLYGSVTSCLSELVRTALIPEPGHRFIVCDYSAIEARVLSWIAGEEWALDEFRGDGLIYEATGARMFGVPKHSIAKGGENHHLRQSAKTAELACLAEGQLVLTDFGLVPIECVQTYMKVWDGENWVWHDGVIAKGANDTIRIGGIELTPDHEILTEKGMVQSGDCEGLHWANIRIPDCDRRREGPKTGERKTSEDADLSVHLRNSERSFRLSLNQEEETDSLMRMQVLGTECGRTHDARISGVQAVQRVERDDSAVSQPERCKLGSIRWSWDNCLLRVAKQLRGFLSRYASNISRRSSTGQTGQQFYVQPRELQVGNEIREWPEQEEQPPRISSRGDNNCSGTCGAIRCEVRNTVESSQARTPIVIRRGRSRVPVYDLLNAGPNHRFCVYDPTVGAIRCVSNCGYGGGMGAMKAFGADKMGMSDEEIVRAVDLWREAHPNVQRLWKALERAAIRCVVHGTEQVSTVGNIRFRMEKGILWMVLPSGRSIAYFDARYGQGNGKFTTGKQVLSYMGREQNTGRWVRLETFSGKITENLVQATARDCLRDAMLALTDAGFRIIAHIHDEVIISEPVGGRTLEDVAEIMGRELPWAKGLPLRGDGYYCNYYIKD